MRPAWLLVGVIALGCGPKPTQTVDTAWSRSSPSSAPDLPAMLAMLDHYSPTGSWIVRAEDTLPRVFTFGGTRIELSSSSTFATYFTDGSPDRLVEQMDTAVHEGYHGISKRLGYKLLVDAHAPFVESEGVYVGGAPMLVEYTARFPSRDMVSTYPSDAKTFRYPTYVSESVENHGTQVDGVFGLLDEWTAYLDGGRTLVDFWPWVRDVAPHTQELYTTYRSRFHGLRDVYAEFKLFILHYVVHARANRPDVYRALVANASFRRAFVAVDDAWTKLLADAAALEPAVIAIATERGAANMMFSGEAAYPAVQRVLASPPYQSALADLRGR